MTTHGHLCILVLRPWIDYHCMIRTVKHITKSSFLYTSRLKTSCRNPYGKTQYMVDAAPGKVTAHLSTETWIDWSIHRNVDRRPCAVFYRTDSDMMFLVGRCIKEMSLWRVLPCGSYSGWSIHGRNTRMQRWPCVVNLRGKTRVKYLSTDA